MFRRITVGPDERLRTAAERVDRLDLERISPDPSRISPLQIQACHDEAFDVEAVTRDFYDKYNALFKILQTDLGEQTKDPVWAHDYVLQFLNRCMFVYFIQRKRWLNNDPDFMKTFWEVYRKCGQPKDSFVARWLNVLFFEAFNEKFHGGHRHFPDAIRSALQMAPYLNGGLFSENDLDGKHRGRFSFSDSRFQQTLNFLERYNFTISEDTPFDQEVAVDAEMLGKVYESLVNVSEETDERGDAGIFYTPRTEIDMMCRLALVDHLANHLGQEHKPLLYEAIFAYAPDEKAEADERLSQANLWAKLDALLQAITVVDPACGSGSFLVGMLQVLDDLIQRANAVLGRQETHYERRKRIIGQSLYGVDVMPWAVDVAELRLWLQLVIETELERAELKFRPLLPNLTFKVRRGDSLVQELGGINMAHLKGTQAISPALKGRLTKLKGEKLKFFNNDTSSEFGSKEEIEREEHTLFRNILETRAHDFSNSLKELRTRALSKDTDLLGHTIGVIKESARRKAEAEAAIIQAELDQTTTALSALKRVKDIPFVWDIAFVEIFDGDRAGFDIVIGNPPYVRQESISNPLLGREEVTTENKKEYKSKLIRSVYRAWPPFFGVNPDKPEHKLDAKSDLYIYFFFHGLSLLNERGSFCFITSNSWLDVGYGKDLQEFLLTHGHVKMIVDNQAKRSFASADVNTAIALLGVCKGSAGVSPANKGGQDARPPFTRFVLFKLPFDQILSPVIFQEIESATERKTTPEYRLFPIDQHTLFDQGCDMPEEEEGECGHPARRSNATARGRDARAPLIKVARYVGNKWGGKYLRAPDIYWTILEKGKGKLVRLGDIAEVRFGIKTGANEFFYLDHERIREWGIEKEFLRPVIKSPRECKRILIDPKDLKFKIFMCHKEKKELKGTAAFEYIKWGEAQGFHERPSCRGRARWWDVGERRFPPIISPSSVSELPRTFGNSSVYADKRLYEIYPEDASKQAVILATNSITSSLFLELGSRTGLGEGLLDLAVYELADCLIVLPSNAERTSACLSKMEERDILGLRAEIEHPDRRKLDRIIFEHLGLSLGEREAVYEAVIDLVETRLKKADSLKPHDRKKRSRAVSHAPEDEDAEE
jgi:hypothetical protein